MKDCILWNGRTNGKGYGSISVGKNTMLAHRAALIVKLKREIGLGLQANHTCHNRRCINPEHLYEGTQKQNMKDCIDAGRHSNKPKRNGGKKKYSDDQIAEVRRYASLGLRNVEIARMMGMTRSYVSRIKGAERR